MTWFDYAVLAIVGISVLFSIMHGFVRELLALASWVVAFLVAQLFATEVAPILTGITNPSLRLLVAFLAVFVATFIAMTVLAILLSSMIKRAGLGAVDRLLGALFGLVRGLGVVMVAVLLAGMTALPQQPDWRHALLSPPLESLAGIVKVWLPDGLSKHIHYEKVSG